MAILSIIEVVFKLLGLAEWLDAYLAKRRIKQEAQYEADLPRTKAEGIARIDDM